MIEYLLKGEGKSEERIEDCGYYKGVSLVELMRGLLEMLKNAGLIVKRIRGKDKKRMERILKY